MIYKGMFTIAMAGAIIGAVLPGNELSDVVPLGGHILHLTTFVFLAFLLDCAWREVPVALKALFLITAGGAIEMTQFFVPYRSCSFDDFIVDGAGILSYYLFVRRFTVPFIAQTVKSVTF